MHEAKGRKSRMTKAQRTVQPPPMPSPSMAAGGSFKKLDLGSYMSAKAKLFTFSIANNCSQDC